jgi:hypothetical protein
MLGQLSLALQELVKSGAWSNDDELKVCIAGTLPKEQIYCNSKHYKEDKPMKFGWTEQNEKLNGRLAMLGFIVAVGTYLTTGQLVPGIF